MEQNKIDMRYTIFSISVNNGKTTIHWNYQLLSKESIESLKTINKLYKEQYFIWLNDTRKKLKPKKERTCRYCGRSFPDVKFSKIAHRFPESAGNKYHISDFECDECNEKFSKYENDFINFLGPFRTLSELPKKIGIPKYKSRDKVLTIEQAFKNAVDLNLSKDGTTNKITYSRDNNILRIQTLGDPNKPINVFRCLLKTAISFVDQDDLKNLTKTLSFLMDDNYSSDISNDFILSMNQFFIPGNFDTPPFLVKFKKSPEYEQFPAPTYIFVFYIRNIILQMFIPFYSKDSVIYNSSIQKHLYLVPPLINDRWFEKFDGPFSKFYNLNDANINHNNIQIVDWKFSEDPN